MRAIELIKVPPGTNRSLHSYRATVPEPEFQAKTIPLLSNIPETALTQLLDKAKRLTYVKKEVLVTELNNDDVVYIIFSGNVQVKYSDAKKQKEILFQILEPQCGYGNIALLPDELRENSEVALEKTVFAVILKSDFADWLLKYPNLKMVSL